MKTAGYNVDIYKKRLAGTMAGFGVEEYSFDYTSHAAWVEFSHKGQQYRLEHSVASAAANGNPVQNGKEAFCQIVLALEDVAQAPDRGVKDLQGWVEGQHELCWNAPLPDCFQRLGFTNLPQSEAEVEQAARRSPVDSSNEWRHVMELKVQCLNYMKLLKSNKCKV